MRISKAVLAVAFVRDYCWQSSFSYSRSKSCLPFSRRPRAILCIQQSELHSTLQENNPGAKFQPEDESLSESEPCCRHCGGTFPTRNALFRHIRTSPTCSVLASGGNVETIRHSLAFLFGYHPNLTYNTKKELTDENFRSGKNSSARVAGTHLQTALVDSVQEVVRESFNVTEATVDLMSSTQASLAKHRHRSLSQDASCAAARDVMLASITAPKLMTVPLWNMVLERVRDRLRQLDDIEVNVVALKIVEPGMGLSNVERSCTQRIYHYLLPLTWLPNGEELKRWWQSGGQISVDHSTSLQKIQKAPSSIHRFKEALRSAECIKLSAKEMQNVSANDRNGRKVASGRFGGLGTRERRPWHNHADPSLKGDASPSNEPVWRVVDRARIVNFVTAPSQLNNVAIDGINSDVLAVLEIKGDDFVQQQVRRIVGTAIAMSHNWLPSDFMETSTRSDTIIETPLAPPGRLYIADTRFHFQEMRTKGQSLFMSDTDGAIIGGEAAGPSSIDWIQKRLLEKTNTASVIAAEHDWLEDLRKTTSHRIRKQLVHDGMSITPSTIRDAGILDSCPDEFHAVLSKLREISANGRWPETSAARSSVVRNLEKTSGNDIRKNGSFTVINPNLAHTVGVLPRGNDLFPDLVEAIFDLEVRLLKRPPDRACGGKLETTAPIQRIPSSYCAVNCNAQFAPHVDSGTGAGQSLSMIVGLGDYHGGELFVESELFNIRYKPLEFDGWKLRHWTNHFEGERYSLVWFTPELGGEGKQRRHLGTAL